MTSAATANSEERNALSKDLGLPSFNEQVNDVPG